MSSGPYQLIEWWSQQASKCGFRGRDNRGPRRAFSARWGGSGAPATVLGDTCHYFHIHDNSDGTV